MIAAALLPVAATISPSTAILVTALAGAASVLTAVVTLAKVRPERDALIAQASEHAMRSMSTLIERIERELEQSRAREGELLRRIEQLEEDRRLEILKLQEQLTEARAEIARLELELAGLRPAD